jgi:hypothetical protein
MIGYDYSTPAPRRLSVSALADRRVTVFLLGAVPVLALGSADGGYYEGSWNWASLVLLWLAGITLISGWEASLDRRSLAFVGFSTLVLGWTLLSELWTSDGTATWLATERQLVYVATAIAGVVVVKRSTVPALVAGLWAGIVLICGWGLLTRLLPDRIGVIQLIGSNRLSGTIGYWNSFGLLAALGLLLALGLTARSRSLVVRGLAGASMPVLATALYFTFSRGAWLALGIGLVAALLADRSRLQLGSYAVALAGAPAVAVAVAWQKASLTSPTATLAQMAHDGHHLGTELIPVVAAGALVAVVASWFDEATELPDAGRRGVHAFLAALVVVGVVAFVVHYGSPWTEARTAWHSFASSAPAPGQDLNNRLFHLSGSGRVAQWKVAWHQAQAHPWLGGGADTWAAYWAQHRPYPATIKTVHNLYLQELSELGPLGLALLVAMLAVPLLAVRRARREPFAAVALGAYAAFLAHSIVDWDWQLTAVTIPALLCGVGLVAAARRRASEDRTRVSSWAVLGLSVVLVGAAVFGAIGHVAVNRIDAAAHAGNWPLAVARTKDAAAIEPWSAEPWKHLGDEAVGVDDQVARDAYLQGLSRSPNNWWLWFGVARATKGPLHKLALSRAKGLDPLEPVILGVRK